MAVWVLPCLRVCVCNADEPGSLSKDTVKDWNRKPFQVTMCSISSLILLYFFEATNPFPVSSKSIIRLEISSNHSSMPFSAVEDLCTQCTERTFSEFSWISQVIIHNICHLQQRTLKHPFNVYLMLLIQYDIKEDMLYDGSVFV